MVALRSVVVAMVAAAAVEMCVVGDRAMAGALDDRSFLLFSGTDIWRYGGFLYGGFLWTGLTPSGGILLERFRNLEEPRSGGSDLFGGNHE